MKNLLEEAERCLQCKNPRCRKFCPIDTAIPEAIALYKEGKIMEAGEMLFENNPLTAVCAIVCPHEDQCKGNCIMGIKGEPVSFCDIEAEVSRHYLENVRFKRTKERDESVAIIGAGPAGITLAFILAKEGYDITIFDAHENVGGIMRYGIPEYRLPNELIDLYKDRLRELGVKFRPNTLIGPVITLDKMFEDGYKAIFIGTGVWNPKPLNIKGETLGNVHYAIDYLKAPQAYEDLGDRVVIIGAGNVAMDASRTAKRNGAKEVFVMYRKGFENMTCTKAELEEAKEDGVQFELFKAPLEITKKGVKYIKTQNETDEDGKIYTKTLEGTEDFFACDTTIIAVSQNPRNNIVSTTTGLDTNKWGLLVTDDAGNTTKKGVFASGDVVTGAKTVVEAAAHAKVVAKEIMKYMDENK
ncbi:MAG: NAD(P)-dependent oxidoreductase [Lachnospiraceae bacterium]|nr:NAD(P)-dependent oxidoreductase [Lachnospiraceae bacterium]